MRATTHLPLLCALCAIAGLSSPVLAQEAPLGGSAVADDGLRARESTYETPRMIAMGSGAHASAMGTHAAAANPANLTLASVYHIEAMGGYVPQLNAWTAGVALADSFTRQGLGAGLSFRGIFGTERTGFDGRISLGVPLGSYFALGASARYLKLTSNVEDENGHRVGQEINRFTMDAALRLTPVQGLHIAALGYNLIPTHSSLAPLMVGGSVAYTAANVFTLGGDFFVDLTTFEDPTFVFGVAAEYLAADSFPLRLGYRRDHGRGVHQITAGIGYVGQAFSADFGLRQDIGSEIYSDTQLVLAVRYHVQ